ncbi:MAG: pilin [Patescibacteria group bacterium]|nr:pilin [Patescibacteria group bacterium]
MKKTINTMSYVGYTILMTLGNKAFAAETVEIIESDATVSEIITKITGWVVTLVGAIAVLFIVWGGVQYITASGNKDKAELAKKTITYAVIGIIVVVLAKVIISLVTGTAGEIVS